MKRIGNIFNEVISLENLRLADERARKGKLKSYGVRVHDKNREANLLALHEILKNGTFKTSKYHIFTIYEPKERLIYRLPYYPDRILHHAIMNVLEPVWVSVFNKNTYSCIKNRGIHKCAKDVKQALKQDPDGTRYCLKIDVRKFYPSIDHELLKGVVRRKIKDGRLLALLDEIIDSVDGVPIGNYLSQYFANLFLAYFDHWLKEKKRVKYYWRYADDIVILSPNKDFLHGLLHEIRVYLRDNLNLAVKRNYQVFPVEARGIDFLGYVFYHSHTLLRKSIKQKLCRRVAKLNKRKIVPTKETYKQQICSWWGWCKHCDSINLVNKLSKTFPYEIKFNRSKRAL
ncbi:retron-type RNA-directed DNA polymerase [Bacteroides pyogenes JCM 6292]|uniref:Retron-type RNA-directed DNA polymerase n=2 Tax=Bacteroides pyogenes TaxID=310300 RepID=W4PGF1_9BACE|nr:RNA-directed DNA polymerase [Bacteroides pyogenes]GAE14584.1 retron-type RNA-directed DNA polymerase [Bacteroides pyogenes JCM 6292]GAE18244.1 retron-type RNA-directed DNA polymerase [Bacteroides pyogenes DSM 20611 = JCM 6294]